MLLLVCDLCMFFVIIWYRAALGGLFVTAPSSARAFKLRGKVYRLSRMDVERAAAKVEPRPTEKYAVMIDGRAYPPKQLIEASLNLLPTTYTTMDANRILGKLGFEVLSLDRQHSSETALQRWQPSLPAETTEQKSEMQEMVEFHALPKPVDRWERLRNWLRDASSGTRAKELFEAYLFATGLQQLTIQQPEEFGGIVDFIFEVGDQKIAFEVKELVPVDLDISSEIEFYDPYRPIRERIRDAEAALHPLKDVSRGLVLYSRCLPLPMLDWRVIYGSLHRGAETRRHYRSLLKPESSPEEIAGLDAVIVLDQLKTGLLRFKAHVVAEESKMKRSLTPVEYMAELQRARGTERDILLSRLRVIVHESMNPRNPLPRDVFRGPYDEWYGRSEDGQIGRIFVGEEIRSLEKREHLTL